MIMKTSTRITSDSYQMKNTSEEFLVPHAAKWQPLLAVVQSHSAVGKRPRLSPATAADVVCAYALASVICLRHALQHVAY